MKKIKPATVGDKALIEQAISMLRSSRSMLVNAGANKAADKVRRALKSAEGAERHVYHRLQRTNKEQVK